ncbi:GNAT family N-acetyltransferase [Pseudomonas sp. NPDC088368]|uniref:GNAT family N-acetyltransferase n=1 Tax=Pseudomonas sp. NPDC088368 TaxID=3364453 RepID=UPI0037F395D6
MIKVSRHRTPVSPVIRDSVLELVGENVTALSMSSPPRSHPLYEGYKAILLAEMHAYITHHDLPQIELLTAVAEDGAVVAFMLIGLVETETLEANIYYTAVRERFRRQGVMTQMMQVVLEIAPVLGLSCDVELVPIYARYGFRPVDSRETQVVMFLGSPTGITPVLGSDELQELGSVIKAFSDAASRTDTRTLKRADKLLKADIAARKVKVRNFLKVNG